MKPTDRPWMPYELEYMRQNFSNLTNKEIASHLHRGLSAVAVKAAKMGLKKSSYGIVWSEQQIHMLRQYYPTMFNKAVAMLCGVSQRTMIRKARELGLQKVEGFHEKRKEAIGKLISDSLRDAPRNSGMFVKGVHSNPAGEFKKGHAESEETKRKRSESLKKAWVKRKKRLQNGNQR